MNRWRTFLVQSSRLPSSMQQKLAKHGRCCMQNNQLPTQIHVELQDKYIDMKYTKVASHYTRSHKLEIYALWECYNLKQVIYLSAKASQDPIYAVENEECSTKLCSIRVVIQHSQKARLDQVTLRFLGRFEPPIVPQQVIDLFLELPLTKGLSGFAEPSICAEMRRGRLLHRKTTSALGTPCMMFTSPKTRMGTSVNPAVPMVSVTLWRWRWDKPPTNSVSSAYTIVNVIFFWGANVEETEDHAIISLGCFFSFLESVAFFSSHLTPQKWGSNYMLKCAS